MGGKMAGLGEAGMSRGRANQNQNILWGKIHFQNKEKTGLCGDMYRVFSRESNFYNTDK